MMRAMKSNTSFTLHKVISCSVVSNLQSLSVERISTLMKSARIHRPRFSCSNLTTALCLRLLQITGEVVVVSEDWESARWFFVQI